MTNVKLFADVAPAASATEMENGKVPVLSGVPASSPLEESSARPGAGGSGVANHRKGGVPPAAVNACVYTRPMVAAGSVSVVMVRAWNTTNENGALPELPSESVTVTVKSNDPATAGEPLRTPVAALSVKPPGTPPAMDQE